MYRMNHSNDTGSLPFAPNMSIYTLYGVGKATERAYHYTLNDRSSMSDNHCVNDDLMYVL